MEYVARMTKNGNIKIGQTMWSWNKLAGSGEIAGCKGTCGKHCNGCYNADNPRKSPCYVFKSYNLYGWDQSSVVKGHVRNTNIMRSDMHHAFNDIQLQLKRARKKPSAVRIHASGELETAQELREWIETAEMFPEIPFYVYTKAYEILDEVLSDIDNDSIPDNFTILISVWHENGIQMFNKWKYLNCIKAFVYVDHEYDYANKLNINCYCPAYDQNGKLSHDFTCDKCRICFNKKCKVIGCYNH